MADPARDIALMVANAIRRAKGMDDFGQAEWASIYACVRRGGGLCAADVVEAVAVADAAVNRARERDEARDKKHSRALREVPHPLPFMPDYEDGEARNARMEHG